MRSGDFLKRHSLVKVLGIMLCAVLPAGMLFLSLILLSGSAAAKGKDKDKQPAEKAVDSGSFGIFQNGHRVATETFSIQQNANGSVATSQFKTDNTVQEKAAQSSELQLTDKGELRRYEWKELSPGHAQALVVPNDEFLMERYGDSPEAKQHEQPFLLPASTSILDDYFFIQREILAWKYLATGCRQQNGQVQCPEKQRVQFGTLNPHSRASMQVSLEFSGREKVAIRGAERELNRLNLESEAGNWTMWLDDQFKLVRIVVKDDNTEVVRD
jgi:hypothetical protein